jgi:hypothetical protein
MRKSLILLVGGAVVFTALSACRRADLSQGGAQVALSRNSPPPGCKSLGYLTARGGGTFGGGMISNDRLTEYAQNDLRNQAAELGANFVQHDPPSMGSGDGTTTTVTVTGTAYLCPEGATAVAVTDAPAAPAAPAAEKSSESKADKDKDEPAPPTEGNAPPVGAVGFRFGQSVAEAEGACSKAGLTWSPVSDSTFDCSGAPEPLGARVASTQVKACASKVCGIQLTIAEADLGGWGKAFPQVQAALAKKYGKPRKMADSHPKECQGDALAACLADGRTKREARWWWDSGEQLSLTAGKSDKSASPSLRVYYYREPDKLGGL